MSKFNILGKIVKPIKTYASYSKDRDVRLSSSSGAVFSSLAEFVFSKSGVVYGVAMSDDCYSAEFISVNNSKELIKLRGSKYLQARVGDTFRRVKDDLISGKLVLFSGTGCQINGLKKFLGEECDNLICVDVICHGTPSPLLWKKYALSQENIMGGKLRSINFRCKDKSWADFGMKEVLKSYPECNVKKLFISKDKDSYMHMFLRDYCLRPSCYECVAKKEKLSDLTIGDFWGIENVAPSMNDGLGTSLILIRTEKGKRIFDHVRNDMRLMEVGYESGVKENPAEYISCKRPVQRDNFFSDMYTMSFKELEAKYASPIKYSVKSRIKGKFKNLAKRTIQKIGWRGDGKSNTE